MKKAMKTGALIVAVALMIGVGVWALTSGLNIEMKSRVYFYAEPDVKVFIEGEIEGGSMDDAKRTFAAYTYDTGDAGDIIIGEDVSDWEIGDIEIVKNADGTYEVKYVFTFTNDESEAGVVIEIIPALGEGASNLTLSGGAEDTNEPSGYSNIATIAAGESVTFTYTLAVVSTKADVDCTPVFSVSLAFADDEEQP